MRILFAGTPEFAARSLQAILDARHSVVGILTQPDRPAGRGLKLQPSPVKRVAQAAGLTVLQPESLRSASAEELIKGFSADVMVVVAYGLVLPAPILALPRLGCINIHASLLPRWRGAAPIQRAIQAGDSQTGISIMQMDAGLDTGPVLLERTCPILPEDTSQSLHDRLAELGAASIVEALDGLEKGILAAKPQPGIGVTYASKITKDEATLDWNKDAVQLERDIRAYNPAPVARCILRGERIRVWMAQALSSNGSIPGTVLSLEEGGIIVACGSGLLRLTRLQRAGGKPMSASEFLQGFPIRQGERMEF
jgi:methionyl-tRNA formyltransferase